MLRDPNLITSVLSYLPLGVLLLSGQVNTRWCANHAVAIFDDPYILQANRALKYGAMEEVPDVTDVHPTSVQPERL